ncbi:hypothetical protein DAF77_02035 [Clostridioides difficile]|nr:hypothetical protein [Clostridioides difficile]EGT4047162.1 hypothetical protein [Clostridioides difficile]EGT4222906.1 hypothetical protein [Clostridioides difficile]EGT4598721.1 hypothetical protein [Clostridioides difficile]EGT4907344.1 hypothetical protein [Clostridioides difficile]
MTNFYSNFTDDCFKKCIIRNYFYDFYFKEK